MLGRANYVHSPGNGEPVTLWRDIPEESCERHKYPTEYLTLAAAKAACLGMGTNACSGVHVPGCSGTGSSFHLCRPVESDASLYSAEDRRYYYKSDGASHCPIAVSRYACETEAFLCGRPRK